MSSNTPESIIKAIKKDHKAIKQVLFVGCGASMADLYPAYYFTLRESKSLQTAIMTGNEFNFDTPKNVGKDTIVISASLGGTTPESVEATKHARELGATTVALSHNEGSPIVEAAEYTIVHGFDKNYAEKVEKMALALELAVEIVNQYEGYDYYNEAQMAFDGIYDLIEDQVKYVGPNAKKFAEQYKDEKTIYVMASGATQDVAYSTANFLFMEMQWIAAPNYNSGEYFHGPFELTVKDAPFLLYANDGKTRKMDMRALTFLQRFDAKYTLIDAKDFGLSSIAGPHVIDYFNPMLLTGVFRKYAEELAAARNHPLSKRRYMWKLEY